MSVNHVYAIALSNPSGNTPIWAISVQPKKQTRLFFHDHAHTSVYLSSGDDTGRKKSDGFKGEELLVKLLVGENDIAGIDKRVAETLSGINKNQASESWLRSAVSTLQQHNLCNNFPVDAFMQVATQTLRSQQEHHDTVAVEVDYLSELGRTKSVEEMHETRDAAMKKGKGGSKHGFWVSRPEGMPKKVRRVNSWERQDDAYGGLM